jgi:putative acetyltransferase
LWTLIASIRETTMHIRTANEADLGDILHVQSHAFGHDKEAGLTHALLHDDSARPLLSLLAIDEEEVLGHILFTTVRIAGNRKTVSSMILAPLAVLPAVQNRGVGGALIRAGLDKLSAAGVDLVFVLGHPGYYPRYGFEPAGVHGLAAPYPIPEKDAGAWMVQELRDGVLGTVRGTIVCADALNQPAHWRE